MAKVIINLICCSLICSTAGAVTNLAQIVGRQIDSAMIEEMPRRDFSTPETAYLNFIRALATANEADWVSGFSSQKIVEYVGVDDPDALTNRVDSPLVEIFSDNVISNMIVTSYTVETVSVNEKKISADIVCHFNGNAQTNSYPIVFCKFNEIWVIASFLEDE